MARQATGQVVERKGKRGRTYALRFRAYGRREYVTLGTVDEGWTRQRAETELANVLADVRRGIWRPAISPVVEPRPEPTFHEFASEWLEAIKTELDPKTEKRYRWQLTNHLLPFFHAHKLGSITVEEVDRYRRTKARQRALSPASITETITRLAQIMEEATEYGYVTRNPARGKRRKLKADRAAPVWLDRAEQIAALLDAARELDQEARADRQGMGRRPLLATMALGGLRVGELCALRWRDVDLAAGRLRVVVSKTAAGVRQVDLLPALLDELKAHKAGSQSDPDALVFPTLRGRSRDPNNVRERILNPAVKQANANLQRRRLTPLPGGLTCHKLRHTFASILIALGGDPRTVMEQLGHTDPAFTLRLYTHGMRRNDGERDRLRALVNGADWAPTGTSDAERDLVPVAPPVSEEDKTPC